MEVEHINEILGESILKGMEELETRLHQDANILECSAENAPIITRRLRGYAEWIDLVL